MDNNLVYTNSSVANLDEVVIDVVELNPNLMRIGKIDRFKIKFNSARIYLSLILRDHSNKRRYLKDFFSKFFSESY